MTMMTVKAFAIIQIGKFYFVNLGPNGHLPLCTSDLPCYTSNCHFVHHIIIHNLLHHIYHFVHNICHFVYHICISYLPLCTPHVPLCKLYLSLCISDMSLVTSRILLHTYYIWHSKHRICPLYITMIVRSTVIQTCQAHYPSNGVTNTKLRAT